ncbi:MAG: protein-disulfide reductase DsbD family protein [Alphaproteobacteria bacterium]|nr:protein-disulfide reductase DsbD family protein [Alphaproteobacteria bacterium]
MLTRLYALLLALLSALGLATAPAWAQPVKTGHAEAELIAERGAVVGGDQFLGALKLDLEGGGWHVYWKNVGDSGLPPEIEWTLPDGVEIGEFVWPAPHAIPLTTLMNYGYERQLVLPFQVTVPASYSPGDTLDLKGHATWLICLETCIPEEAELSFSVPVEAAPRTDAKASGLIAASLAQTPQPLTGSAAVMRTKDGFRLAALDDELANAMKTAQDARFFPDGQEIVNAADQKIEYGASGVTIDMTASEYAPKGEAPLSGAIVVEDEDGTRKAWLVGAQPGGLPPGTTGTGFGAGGGLGLAALASLLGAAFLGGLVLNLMPCVLPVLSIKAAGLVHTAHNPAESRAHGLAYMAGVLVCFAVIGAILAGLRLAGEQAGLGFQLQYPPMVAVFALLMFAVGLNLLGVFEIGGSLMGVGGKLADQGGTSGAFFTGVLAAFVGAPCVGPFMAPAVGVALAQPPLVVIGVFLVIGLGLAAPFVALSFTPALARLLPKPGRWMATFRQVLAFPMFLTAIWLLWVLGAQTGADGVILVVGGAVALSFGIWLATKFGQGMGGRVAAGLVILAALLGPAVAAGSLVAPASQAGGLVAAEAGSEAWSPQRVAELRAENRVIFVDFTARWCATCQVNKKLAIDSNAVRKAFAEYNVAFLIADWTNRDSVIAAALAEHDRAGVPLYLVYPASGDDPLVLPQMLSPGLLVKAFKDAAGQETVAATQTGETL